MAGYSESQIARFLRIDPNWKPPVKENRFRFECDEISYCRCYCTMCSNLVFNLRHNCDWKFSSNNGIPHSRHDDDKICINTACMFSVSEDPHPETTTLVKQPKKFHKSKKHKKNFLVDLKGKRPLPPKGVTLRPSGW